MLPSVGVDGPNLHARTTVCQLSVMESNTQLHDGVREMTPHLVCVTVVELLTPRCFGSKESRSGVGKGSTARIPTIGLTNEGTFVIFIVAICFKLPRPRVSMDVDVNGALPCAQHAAFI